MAKAFVELFWPYLSCWSQYKEKTNAPALERLLWVKSRSGWDLFTNHTTASAVLPLSTGQGEPWEILKNKDRERTSLAH